MTDDVVETPATAAATALAPAANPDLRWYVVHAYSGMEKAVERNILERINRAGMQEKFGRILVPCGRHSPLRHPARVGRIAVVGAAEQYARGLFVRSSIRIPSPGGCSSVAESGSFP